VSDALRLDEGEEPPVCAPIWAISGAFPRRDYAPPDQQSDLLRCAGGAARLDRFGAVISERVFGGPGAGAGVTHQVLAPGYPFHDSREIGWHESSANVE